jgi:hypothetical protein
MDTMRPEDDVSEDIFDDGMPRASGGPDPEREGAMTADGTIPFDTTLKSQIEDFC